MKKVKYYYSVTTESETGQRLQAFMNKCAAAEEQARKWAEKIGADPITSRLTAWQVV